MLVYIDMKQMIWALAFATTVTTFHSGTSLAAQNLSLQEYLKAVEVQSPDLQIEKSLKEEASARSQGIRINPTMVGLMNMRDPSGNNQGIEISQEIPFPTKIAKEKAMRDSEAQAQKSGFQYRKNEILLQARNAYVEFWQIFEKAQIIKEKRDWLKSHFKISRSAARADSAAQVHLLGIESEVDLLENELLQTESQVLEKRNTLRTFAPELQISEINPTEPPLETLNAPPKTKSALIVWKETELQAAEAGRSYKNQSYWPDLYLRYRGYNGNDTAPRSEEVMVGITVPFVFFWQPRAETAEASAKSQRAQAELRKTQIDSENRLASLLQKSQALKKQLDTLNDKLIPRAHKRMKLVENLSQRTMEGLDEHRTVMTDYLDLRMKALEAHAEYENTNSEILKLTSSEVTP